MKIKVEIKVLPDQPCFVLNYRCKPEVWEYGHVQFVDVSIDSDGNPRVQYRVTLERTSKRRTRFFPQGGGHILLTVGENKIKEILKKKK